MYAIRRFPIFAFLTPALIAPTNRIVHVGMTTGIPSHPFTKSDHADIVLRSHDGVDFYADKIILSLASESLETMFSLPQPASEGEADLPTIEMSEDAETLEGMLRECYPGVESTALQNLKVLGKVLQMAEKFDMTGVTEKLGTSLERSEFMENEPLRVYAIARRHGLIRVAAFAAKASLLYPALQGLEHPAEVDEMSRAAHQDLIIYREQCIDVLTTLIENWRRNVWSEPTVQPSWYHCSRGGFSGQSDNCPRLSGIIYNSMPKFQREAYRDCSMWFIDHVERLREAFRERVSASTVSSIPLIKATMAAIRSANLTCSCGISGPYHLQIFSEALAKKVGEALDAVCELLIYCTKYQSH